MTPTLLARLSLRRVPARSEAGCTTGNNQRRARLTLTCFLAAALAINAGAMVLLDDLRPGIRDPEYGRRVRQYQARVAENPGRPMALVVGSSRSAMGVRPGAWEENGTPSSPMLFNLSLLGGGPVMELMVVRRAFADGLRPAIVLLEYWPPYLYSENSWTESRRIVAERLSRLDRPIVHDYFANPQRTEARMRAQRWNPLWESRERLLIQLFPKWLRNDRRIDWMWHDVDAWGWKPGFEFPPEQTAERARMIAVCRDTYRPLFADYHVSPSADRALREAVAVAREHGAAVGFVYLPESNEFRSWYTPAAERQAREHLTAIGRDLAVPVINARDWMPDGMFVDGFHLTHTGAAEFTRKLGPAVEAAFPEARR